MIASRGMVYSLKLAPVLFLVIAAAVWFNEVQESGPWVARNLLPLGLVFGLAALTLARGEGRWTGAGYTLPLGTIGFAIPALGLAAYLHYAYSVNLNGMFDGATRPAELFRFLPAYTIVAGGLGFAIGWIVGRSI
jgi:hypothetical protein